jgi:hypothetical protein
MRLSPHRVQTSSVRGIGRLPRCSRAFKKTAGSVTNGTLGLFAAGSDGSLGVLGESLETAPVEPGNVLSGALAWRAAILLFPNYWTPVISASRVVMSAPNSVRSGKPRSR